MGISLTLITILNAIITQTLEKGVRIEAYGDNRSWNIFVLSPEYNAQTQTHHERISKAAGAVNYLFTVYWNWMEGEATIKRCLLC